MKWVIESKEGIEYRLYDGVRYNTCSFCFCQVTNCILINSSKCFEQTSRAEGFLPEKNPSVIDTHLDVKQNYTRINPRYKLHDVIIKV